MRIDLPAVKNKQKKSPQIQAIPTKTEINKLSPKMRALSTIIMPTTRKSSREQSELWQLK